MRVDDFGTGPSILAIHGLGGGGYYFHGLARRLQPDYRLLAVDLADDSRTDYSMDSWVDELGAILDDRGAAPVVLLGHSLGTMVALRAWAAWPERIRGLMFVGGLPQVMMRIKERLSLRLETLAGARDLLGWGSKVSPGVFSPSTFRDRPEVVALYERLFDAQSIDAYTRCCRILLEAQTWHIVPTVYVPYVAITGAHDQYAPPDAVRAFADEVPQAPRVEIIHDCGHVPFLEQPEIFAGIVKSFMRTC